LYGLQEKRSLAEVERERNLAHLQAARVAAAAELATLSIPTDPRRNVQHPPPVQSHLNREREKAGKPHEPVSETPAAAVGGVDAQRAAAHLYGQLSHSNVSPWVVDEYNEWAGEQVSAGSASIAGAVISSSSSSVAAVGSSTVPAVGAHSPGESIREIRSLVRALVQGMRSVVWCLMTYKKELADAEARASSNSSEVVLPPDPTLAAKAPPGTITVETIDRGGPNGLGPYNHGTTMSEHELKLLRKYTRYGLRCLDVFVLSPSSTLADNNEICEAFPFLFQYCEKHQIRDIFSEVLPELLSRVFETSALMAVPQGLLVQKETCRPIADCILASLTKHVHFLNVNEDGSVNEWVCDPVTPSQVSHVRSGRYLRTHGVAKPRENKFAPQRSTTHQQLHLVRQLCTPGASWSFNQDGEFDKVLPRSHRRRHVRRRRPSDDSTGRAEGEEQLGPEDDKTLKSLSAIASGSAVDSAAHAVEQSESESDSDTVTSDPDDELVKHQVTLRQASQATTTPAAATPAKVMSKATTRATQFLRLFKVVLMSLAEIPPDVNNGYTIDPILTLRPFIAPLVRSTLRNALASKYPFHQIYLLRTLFRQVSQATVRNDPRDSIVLLYAEFQPLVAPILDTCFRIYASCSDPLLREACLEICLSMPLRLSMTLPHLPKVLSAITLGLRIVDDRKHLPQLALKMLDYWVDNLTPTFLYAVMSFTPNTLQELMSALTSLMKPAPSQYGADVVRVLGKLGGLNRLYLAMPPRLAFVAGRGTQSLHATPGCDTGEHSANIGLRLHARWNVPQSVYRPPHDIADHSQTECDATVRNVDAPGSMDGDSSIVEIPLSKTVHFAHRLLLRYFRPLDDEAVALLQSALGKPALAAAIAASTSVFLQQNTPFSPRRITPSNAAGIGEAALLVATPAGAEFTSSFARAQTAGDEWRRPLRRMQRLPETGECVYVTPTQSLRHLPADAPADIAAKSSSKRLRHGRAARIPEMHDSDSDSGADADSPNDGRTPGRTYQPAPFEALLQATRGALVAKRNAWQLLCSIIPLLLEEMPCLAEAPAWFSKWIEQGCISPVPSTRETTPASVSGTTMTEELDANGKVVRVAAPSHDAHIFSVRRLVIEIVHGLAVAASDHHLSEAALPLLLSLVQRITMLSILSGENAFKRYSTEASKTFMFDHSLLNSAVCSLVCDDSGPAHASQLRPVVFHVLQRGMLYPMLHVATARNPLMLDPVQLSSIAIQGSGKALMRALVQRIVAHCYMPATQNLLGACRLVTAAAGAFGPSWLTEHADALIPAVIRVLNAFHPDSAAHTITTAYKAMELLVRAVCDQSAADIKASGNNWYTTDLHEILTSAAPQSPAVAALLQCIKVLALGLTSFRAVARDACMHHLLYIATTLLQKTALPSPVALANGELRVVTCRATASLISQHCASIMETLLSPTVPVGHLPHAEIVGRLFGIASFLNFVMDAMGTRTSVALSSYASWQAFIASVSSRYVALLSRLQEVIALTTTKAYNCNVPAHSPDAMAAASTMNALFTLKLSAEVTSKAGVASIGGQRSGPITIAGALSLHADPASLPLMPASSTLNPAHEIATSLLEEHEALFAAQSFPYPLQSPTEYELWDKRPIGLSELGVQAGWLDHPLVVTSARYSEQLSDGKFPTLKGLGFLGTRVFDTPLLSQIGDRAQVPCIVEVLPRAYDPQLDFRPLSYQVLVRLGCLRFMEACARALPQCFITPLPAEALASNADMLSGPPLRSKCFTIMFDCVPSLHAEKDPAEFDIHSGLLLTDRLPPVLAPAAGHTKQVMLAVHDALSAFHLRPEAERTTLTMLDPSGPPDSSGTSLSLPRELLHTSLRPMLSYFQDFKKINSEILEALGGLLTRISYCFNTALADKLIKDITLWVNPESLRTKLGNTGREPELAASVMNLFHLLPLDPTAFTPKFVKAVCILDAKMHLFRSRGILTTPFRKAFARYMSRYPLETATFFFTDYRLLNSSTGALFDGAIRVNSIMGAKGAKVVQERTEVHAEEGRVIEASGFHAWVKSPEGWIATVKALLPDIHAAKIGEPAPALSKSELSVLHYYFSRLVDVISKYDPGWILTQCGNAAFGDFEPIGVVLQLWASPSIQSRMRVIPATIPVVADLQTSDDDIVWLGLLSEAEAGSATGPKLQDREQVVSWRLPSCLRANIVADVRSLMLVLMRTVKQYISALHSTAEMLVPPKLSVVLDSVFALLHVMSPFSRIDAHDVRNFIRSDISSAPHWGFRNALLSRCLESVAAGQHSTQVAAATGAVQTLRHLVQPVLKHAFASEEQIARLLADGDKEEAMQLYAAVGGVRQSDIDGSVLEPSEGSGWFFTEVDNTMVGNTSMEDINMLGEIDNEPVVAEIGMHSRIPASAARTQPTVDTDVVMADRSVRSQPSAATPSTSARPSSMRTPTTQRKHHGFGGTGSVQMTLQHDSVASGKQRQALRGSTTPSLNTSLASLASTNSLPQPSTMSWSEATYAYGGKSKTMVQAIRDSDINEAKFIDTDTASVAKATYAPRYPFPRLIGRQVLRAYLQAISAGSAPEAPPGESESSTAALVRSNSMGVGDSPTLRRKILSEDVRIELLRLSDVLLAHIGLELHSEKKPIIMFAWNILRTPVSLQQAWAYKVMCRYYQVYQAPFKMQLSLLQHITEVISKPDGRDIYRRALNLLLPTLQLRCTDSEWAMCTRFIKKFIVDEMHFLPNATFVWALIVDHARLFYPFRVTFFSHMLVTLQKLLLNATPSPLQRQLALELLSLCATWQAQARAEFVVTHAPATSTDVTMGATPHVSADGAKAHVHDPHKENRQPHYPTPPACYGAWAFDGAPCKPTSDGSTGSPQDDELIEFVVGMTCRLAVTSCEIPELRSLTRRSINLFASYLRLFPDVAIKVSNLERPASTGHAHAQAMAQYTQSMTAYQKTIRELPAGQQPPKAAPTKPTDTVPQYHCTVLELFLAVMASEGRTRDFVCDHAGFIILTLTPVFASSDRRALALLRRFFRKLMFLFPHSHPSPRMIHVRLYPWVGSCISMRFATFQGYAVESQTNYARIVSDQNEPPLEVRSRSKDESTCLRYLVDGLIKAPVTSPGAPQATPEQLAKFKPEELARATQLLNRAYPNLTWERARVLAENYRQDDKMAREGWQLVKELGGPSSATPDAPPRFPSPSEANILGLTRLLRDVSRFAHNFVHPLAVLLFGLFSRFFDDHLNADAASTAQESQNHTLTTLAGPAGTYVTDGSNPSPFEARAMRTSALALLIPILSHRSVFIATQRGPFIVCVMKLLQRSNDKAVLRMAMKQVSSWMTAGPSSKGAITYGLTQREKMNFISAMVSFGVAQLPANQNNALQRQSQLNEVYHLLQDDYMHLLILLYTGNSNVAQSFNTSLLHSWQVASLVNTAAPGKINYIPTWPGPLLPHLQSSATRPPAWLISILRRTITPGLVCGNAAIRKACFNLLVADTRVRRVRDLREEVERYNVARKLATARHESTKARRRAVWASELGLADAFTPGLSAPLKSPDPNSSVPLKNTELDFYGSCGLPKDLSVPSADLLSSIADAVSTRGDTSTYAVGKALNDAGLEPLARAHVAGASQTNAQLHGTHTIQTLMKLAGAQSASKGGKYDLSQVKYALSLGEEQENWHSNVDSDTAALLYASLLNVSAVAPVDNRARFVAFAGIEGDAKGSPLTALQDILSCDWDPLASFLWLPIAVRMLLQNVHETNAGVAEGPPSSTTTVLHHLQEISTCSIDIAAELWQTLFPSAWSSLDDNQRTRLTPHVQNILIRDLHQHQISSGSPCANLEMALGFAVKERERDAGFGAASSCADSTWSAYNPPLHVLEAASGVCTVDGGGKPGDGWYANLTSVEFGIGSSSETNASTLGVGGTAQFTRLHCGSGRDQHDSSPAQWLQALQSTYLLPSGVTGIHCPCQWCL
jgi:hypothetical protein